MVGATPLPLPHHPIAQPSRRFGRSCSCNPSAAPCSRCLNTDTLHPPLKGVVATHVVSGGLPRTEIDQVNKTRQRHPQDESRQD